MSQLRRIVVLIASVALAGVAAAPASASGPAGDGKIPQAIPAVDYEGVQHLRYRFGPVKIIPGANGIEFDATDLKPPVPGYITRFTPNLERADGTVPPVDELHLHHAVWIMRGQPTFAAGEEKTITQLPPGFGYRYDPKDPWVLNHMIHNLLPNKDTAYITYDIDFVPATAPGARGMREAKPLWLDVAGLSAYPVFDVKRAWGGRDGRYTFPDDVRTRAESLKRGPLRRHLVDRPMTLLGTAGHLHPGGLYTTMKARREGQTRELFRSEARYWEPAGPVSWDVAMTATPMDWRVKLRPGDELKVSATYETRKASWYESMGIMVTWYADDADVAGRDPFTEQIATRGTITHGRLPENGNHGGGPAGLPDARRMASGPPARTVSIRDFVFRRGDLGRSGRAARPPVVRQGQSLTFRNLDSTSPASPLYHTITACREPCNKATGVAYPLANGRADFDSGTLGFGPQHLTAAANRNTWQTPKNLKPGTYTYFCRIHPFMRGAFRVIKAKSRRGAR